MSLFTHFFASNFHCNNCSPDPKYTRYLQYLHVSPSQTAT
jgi:hypothetical protein